jgi:hypothetical protein
VEAADAFRLLDNKADVAYINEALSRKANASTVSSLMDKVEVVVAEAAQGAVVKEELASKANTKVRVTWFSKRTGPRAPCRLQGQESAWCLEQMYRFTD